jgi:hypothetical protein
MSDTIQSTNLQALIDLTRVADGLLEAKDAVGSSGLVGSLVLPSDRRGALLKMRSTLADLYVEVNNEITKLRIQLESGTVQVNDSYTGLSGS